MYSNVIEELAAQMEALQSFKYKSLSESKKEICIGDIKHCFDALSFCQYSSSLNSQEHSYLKKLLYDYCESNMSNDERKCRSEYESLFYYLLMPNNPYRDYAISKETRPDFILEGNMRIGIEVVEFITEQRGIMNKVANKNFGRGKSAEEIHDAARSKHGSKAEQFTFHEICGSPAISLKGLEDINQTKMLFATKILGKWRKYKDMTSLFDRFYVLCDARSTIAVTNKNDSDEIRTLLEKFDPNISDFTICIMYDGNNKMHVAEYAL